MIRPATHDDVASIATWTQDTFDWGDYVSDALPAWIGDPSIGVFVYEEGGAPVAVAKGQLLSATEAWMSAARVHPDHRGKRIAGRLADALMEWARDRGALVARLLIEDWNEASIRHVERVGLRRVAGVAFCVRTVGEASPIPEGNGGTRKRASVRARPARSAEAEAAFASWSVGELGKAMRGMVCHDWTARRLTVGDLQAAARNEALWEIGGGWAIAAREEGLLNVGWIETRREDADEAVRALVDLAVASHVEEFRLWIPTVDWLVRAARRAGCDAEPMGIYVIDL